MGRMAGGEVGRMRRRRKRWEGRWVGWREGRWVG